MDETGDLGALKQGRLLGGRFEIHGVIGRGGTATVVLATDRLRGERVALKIVHPHLASDPAAQRRLRREVKTASVLRSDAALVPNDLHEIDGMLALSMPFHPGQTLAERVATRGALSPDEVRALGIRLASALSDAHRAGVLHRDVTPNNVLLGDEPSSAVLTDFGLARLTLGQTRSTGTLGTAGYAAPEIYEGERADPRSDLYGLGAVLYLAAAGSPPFDARSPMASLKQQLEGSFERLSAKAPKVPADLAAVIEALLSPDPKARPATARDVIDTLEGHSAQKPSQAQRADAARSPVARVSGRFLPQGRYTVVVRERAEDRERRDRLRRATDAPRGLPDEIARIGWHLADRVRDAFGVPKAAVLTPEEQLVTALAAEMQIPPDAIAISPVLKRKSFRLVDATDKETAEQLAEAAQASGFRAEVRALEVPEDPRSRWWYAYFVALAVGWSTLPFEMKIFGGHFLWVMIAISAGVPIALEGLGVKAPQSQRQRAERLPVAYRADLADGLATNVAVTPRFPTQPSRESPPQQILEQKQRESAQDEPGARAEESLDGLDALLADPEITGLPAPALRDLSETSRELRARARLLSLDVRRLRAELSSSSREDDQLSVLSARLARLETLARAGEASNREERERLSKAIERHEESQRAAERVESEWIAASAQLFEIASAADRIRRELLLSREDRSVSAWVERLSREAKAATEARQEADPGARARDAARAQAGRERA